MGGKPPLRAFVLKTTNLLSTWKQCLPHILLPDQLFGKINSVPKDLYHIRSLLLRANHKKACICDLQRAITITGEALHIFEDSGIIVLSPHRPREPNGDSALIFLVNQSCSLRACLPGHFCKLFILLIIEVIAKRLLLSLVGVKQTLPASTPCTRNSLAFRQRLLDAVFYLNSERFLDGGRGWVQRATGNAVWYFRWGVGLDKKTERLDGSFHLPGGGEGMASRKGQGSQYNVQLWGPITSSEPGRSPGVGPCPRPGRGFQWSWSRPQPQRRSRSWSWSLSLSRPSPGLGPVPCPGHNPGQGKGLWTAHEYIWDIYICTYICILGLR